MSSANRDKLTQPPRLANLPTVPTSFIGRKREIVEISQLLTSKHLLSLVGAGGGAVRHALHFVWWRS